MKTTLIVLSAAALIAAGPAVAAQHAATPDRVMHHKISKGHHPRVVGHAPRRKVQATGAKRSYPGGFGYAPAAPSDYATGHGTSGGGGGGGGGGW